MEHIRVENIEQFNHYFHQPTYHPQVSVARLQDADLSLFEPTDFCMYCVVLMEVDFGELVLHDTCMRYRGGTMFTMKPGDVVSMNLDSRVKPHGWMLAFRPEQLNGTGLGRDFYMFNFFEYKVAEALELFDSERRVIINCFNNIYTELQAPDDELTSHMLRLGIGQLLTCCRRFYDRQFDTKNLHSSDLGKRLDKMVDEYLSEGSNKLRTQGPPTVAWCAEQFHLTPSYFGDVVRREMGITPQAFLQTKLIDRAKSLLASQELTINEIAEELGFSYPNHFARLFRQKTGMSPSAFRKQLLKE
ncbi:helix-turn-helix domain-containing protein [Segatella copri]|uniref:helix-turn-helix domain-containing protein n=1 Tax=Segatella copri TaxID=165179 RepID=UPI001291951F|nr:helix-turn-helix transcriptional regulator [Segatella copri]MQN16182.1 helix-turn-helix transcriptional regulator [Segatella copri]MQN18837.1 helix-turn-helix transcriptional regulator [Segatella copri]